MLEVSPEQVLIDLIRATCTGTQGGKFQKWAHFAMGCEHGWGCTCVAPNLFYFFPFFEYWLITDLNLYFNTYYMVIKIFICRV